MSHVEAAPPRLPGGSSPAHAAPQPGWFARHPAWPVATLLIGFPLWWLLGISDYAFVVLAIPMAVQLRRWHRRGDRRILVPPGFGLWLLFLIVALAGGLALARTAPGTVASPVTNRLVSYTLRTLSYLAVTLLLLFAGNLTESELPRRRLAWLLGLVGIYATVGGLAGTAFPHIRFTSPLAFAVPQSLQQSNLFLQAMLHPGLAQVQNVLGAAEGRPDAPFVYTNEWGNCIALLLPWLIVAWWRYGTPRQRKIAVVTLALSVVPIIYSLDRGLWIGLCLALVYLAARLAARGKLALLGGLVTALIIVAIAVAATPLQNLITQRLNHGQSDAVRSSLSVAATRAALSSPLIGYGDTRHQQGSVKSIAVGRSAKCQQCGEVTIGGNGQLWLLLVCTGFVGTAFYLSFFAFGSWRFWGDQTPYGTAGVLVLLLTFVFMIAYSAVGAPLGFTMLSYALLWRSDISRRSSMRPAQGQVAPAGVVRRPPASRAGQEAPL